MLPGLMLALGGKHGVEDVEGSFPVPFLKSEKNTKKKKKEGCFLVLKTSCLACLLNVMGKLL